MACSRGKKRRRPNKSRRKLCLAREPAMRASIEPGAKGVSLEMHREKYELGF